MSEVRYFTTEGRRAWNDWLVELRANPLSPFPTGLLENGDVTRRAPGKLEIKPERYTSAFELAKALAPIVAEIRSNRFPSDRWPGLWDWLAAYHFDSICSADKLGRRSLREHARYYLHVGNFRRVYRHRIFGPVELYLRYGDASALMISGEPSTVTDWEEQAASRYPIKSNQKIARALYQLYWDPAKKAPKRGAAPNKKVPGTLRRFSDLVQQLDRTFDLATIGDDAILRLLPKEFDRFRPPAIAAAN
jgi:hypothetical protein